MRGVQVVHRGASADSENPLQEDGILGDGCLVQNAVTADAVRLQAQSAEDEGDRARGQGRSVRVRTPACVGPEPQADRWSMPPRQFPKTDD